MKKLLIIVLSLIIMSGCAPINYIDVVPSETGELEEKDYKQILDNATEIQIKESAISIGKKYNIIVDGEQVATVSGKAFNNFGDVFTLEDNNGNFLLKEKERKRLFGQLTRLSSIMDKDDNVVGYIGEKLETKFFSIGYTFHFFDSDENEIGKSDTVNFTIMKENKYYDNDGNIMYEVNKELSIGGDKYTLKVNDTSVIPLYHAIFMVCIEDAIVDANDD